MNPDSVNIRQFTDDPAFGRYPSQGTSVGRGEKMAIKPT